MYKAFFKKAVDFLMSLVLALLMSPFWLMVALIIKLESKGPIFFVQVRLGMGGRKFKLFKFRTMKVNQLRMEDQVFKQHSDISPFGSFLRRLKIDETPQLLNILKGDMSLIGPRPCLPSLRERFDVNGEIRLMVKPGLSGWAQVNGNIYNSWEKRWEYDAFYARNLSFCLDLKILMKTALVVIVGEEKK
tara:strand:+ start:826 stop:1392 length:567 start_codon:yes stop_codon:yes gene_type:complete